MRNITIPNAENKSIVGIDFWIYTHDNNSSCYYNNLFMTGIPYNISPSNYPTQFPIGKSKEEMIILILFVIVLSCCFIVCCLICFIKHQQKRITDDEYMALADIDDRIETDSVEGINKNLTQASVHGMKQKENEDVDEDDDMYNYCAPIVNEGDLTSTQTDHNKENKWPIKNITGSLGQMLNDLDTDK
eukprot:446622_1